MSKTKTKPKTRSSSIEKVRRTKMPNVRKKDSRRVIGIGCGDIHLSHTAPIARQGEKDWYGAMRRPLVELRGLARKYECSIFYDGDIFHKWNSPAELINFAMDCLPVGFAIPGQHDLPYHDYNQVGKSAYQCLVKAGKIHDLSNNQIVDGSLLITGFQWNKELTITPKCKATKIALVHKYVWKDGYSYPDAPQENHLFKLRSQLKGYDVAFFGDNHLGFISDTNKSPIICNTGGFMRRNSDQINYKPFVVLLYADKTVKKHYLDCSKDIIEKPVQFQMPDGTAFDIEEALNELDKLEVQPVSYVDQLIRYFDKMKTHPAIRSFVLKAAESK